MTSYKPPFTISNRMLELVSSISEKLGQMSGYRELESRPHLRRMNRIKSIHSSLKIEANSLSLTDVKDVIDGHAVLGSQSEIQEVKNAYRAYDEIERIDPYSIEELKRIHGIMTDQLVSDAGLFRKGNEGVFSEGRCIFVAPPPDLVPELMNNLFCWMNESKGSVHPLILSAVFHYEFVFIHPFADGNGRMARLWHTALLYNWKHIFEYIPIESQIEQYQSEYYSAIAQCHAAGNSDTFIEFMLDMIDKILDDVASQITKSALGVSEYVKKLDSVMECGVPYTSNAIMKELGLKSKENLRKNYINPAMEMDMVQMTLPDKPNSKNQRYIKL